MSATEFFLGHEEIQLKPRFTFVVTIVNDKANISDVVTIQSDTDRFSQVMTQIRSWIEANKSDPSNWTVFKSVELGIPDEF